MQNKTFIAFVEVKDVLHIDDVMGYITNKKRRCIRKTMDTYLWKYAPKRIPRIDVAFTRGKEVFRVIENCEDF